MTEPKQSWFKRWLNKKSPIAETNLTDFDQLKLEIRSGDIILVEGRTRVSEIIRTITQSRWTHSAIYIGSLVQHQGRPGYELLKQHWKGDHNEPLLLEGILGKGTIINSLFSYQTNSIRVCRPTTITPADIEQVIDYVVSALGTEYDMRQLFDLARFMMPWPIVPRRWRSTLFNYKPGENTKTVCSSLIAEGFQKVHYPILPLIKLDTDGKTTIKKRNPRLYTPADYDYSPYFSILKFPSMPSSVDSGYRNLPWDHEQKTQIEN